MDAVEYSMTPKKEHLVSKSFLSFFSSTDTIITATNEEISSGFTLRVKFSLITTNVHKYFQSVYCFK